MSTVPEATPDVVRDLLPAYVWGETTADTRTFVEAWLRRDPALAREAEALRGVERDFAAAPAAPARPDAERTALLRVRALLRARSLAIAGGIFFSLLPFASVVSSKRGIDFVLFRDAPVAGILALVLAAGSWLALWAITRRLHGAGRQDT
jgi:anti-sigma factor RsiW